MTLDQYMGSVEREALYLKLIEVDWNYTEAARQLGISYRSMRYRTATTGIGWRNKPTPKPRKTNQFDKAWPGLRMLVLKRDGRRCRACGATPEHGISLHVDHIKPKNQYPELALDPSNLQILCELCNVSKGSRDQTDWSTVA